MRGVKHSFTQPVKQPLIVFLSDTPEYQEMLDTIGKRIAAVIKSSQLSQSQIADQIGVTRQAITGWISNSAITKQNLNKFCKVTGARMEYLLDGTGEMFTIESVGQEVKEQRAHYSMEAIERLNRIEQLSPADQARLDKILDAFNIQLDRSADSRSRKK